MKVWRHTNARAAGYAYNLSEAIGRADREFPDLLWSVNSGLQIMLSDYSGQHRQATHEAYSFLITTYDDVGHWLPLRQEFRRRWLPDGRRLSFKQLREPMRRRSYPHFLELAAQLPANLITIMVDRRVGSFAEGGAIALAEIFDDCFVPGATAGNVEKIYRLALFVALMLAGLRDERQRSIWVSDHDETLDTFQKREGFARLAAYLTYGLTGWTDPAEQEFTTTERTDIPEWIEDLAAIPDIAAGACACLSGHLPTFLGASRWTVPINRDAEVDWRARTFGDRLSAPVGQIRHVLVRLEPNGDGEIQASAQKFLRRPRQDEAAPS